MLHFRKINPALDCGPLYELLRSREKCQLPHQPRFLHQKDFFDWLMNQLSGYYHDFFVIEDPEASEPDCVIGFLVAFDYRSYDGHCQIGGYANCGLNSSLLGEFVDFLFREYPLNKVFLETADIREPLIRSAEELGFIREAILPAYLYISGSYHDLVIMGLNSQKRRESLCQTT